MKKSAMAAESLSEESPLSFKLFFIISAACVGLYYEWLACIAAIALLGFLLRYARRGFLRLPGDISLYAVLSVLIGFLLSPLWAVDKGMTVYGFFKALPLLLFLLCISQNGDAGREALLKLIPTIGIGMTLLSWPLSLIPPLTHFFTVDGRLAGFFQYPNAFAALLLCGMALLLFDKSQDKLTLPKTAILFLGLLLSGSRTAFVLALGLVLFALVRQNNPSVRIATASIAALSVLAAAAYSLLGGDIAAGRFLTLSLRSSTFLGRLLYAQDALPVILRHPFGLGYLGYRFLQGSFQTGVYSVTYVHNELLQLLLDVGWIPAILWLIAIGKTLLSKSCPLQRKVLIAVLGLHSLFDFDFQYPFLCFILLLALEPDKQCRSFRPVKAAVIPAICLCAACLYFGLAAALLSFGHVEKAVKVYPGHTLAWLALLPEQADIPAMEDTADHILAHNDSVFLAHSAKARAAFSRGEIAAMIAEKEQAIRLAPYILEEYLDYFDMLSYSIELFRSAGDADSAAYCREKLLSISEMLRHTEEGTSALGWRIQDRPELTLPASYAARLIDNTH